MPEEHAKLSASGAKKWMNCTMSAEMETLVPEKASQYALEGTTAHKLGEAKLRYSWGEISRPEYYLLIKDLETDKSMEDYTDAYRDFVSERINVLEAQTGSKTETFAEQKVDLSKWVPESFGTADIILISGNTMEIIDLKYGIGVPVYAVDNPQIKLYALGALNEYGFIYDIENVIMTIFQPRRDNISTESMTAEALFNWAETEVKPKASAAFEGKGEAGAGVHCDDGFCKARPICRAYAEERKKAERFHCKNPNQLSEYEIAEILEEADQLSRWAKLVKDYALERAVNDGMQFPGFKLVEGRSNREYGLPDDEIASVLMKHGYTEEQVYKRTLKTITEMEKLLGQKDFQAILKGYVIKPSGKPTLVPQEDKRPEWHKGDGALGDFAAFIEQDPANLR